MSDTRLYTVWPNSRSWRSEMCRNGPFQRLIFSPNMHVIKIVMVNFHTPRQQLNFNWTDFLIFILLRHHVTTDWQLSAAYLFRLVCVVFWCDHCLSLLIFCISVVLVFWKKNSIRNMWCLSLYCQIFVILKTYLIVALFCDVLLMVCILHIR